VTDDHHARLACARTRLQRASGGRTQLPHSTDIDLRDQREGGGTSKHALTVSRCEATVHWVCCVASANNPPGTRPMETAQAPHVTHSVDMNMATVTDEDAGAPPPPPAEEEVGSPPHRYARHLAQDCIALEHRLAKEGKLDAIRRMVLPVLAGCRLTRIACAGGRPLRALLRRRVVAWASMRHTPVACTACPHRLLTTPRCVLLCCCSSLIMYGTT